MDVIDEFIKKKAGKATYGSWLKKYFEIINTPPNTYFKEKSDYDVHILNFCDAIANWAPQTKKSAVSCIKNFFKFNNIGLQPATEYTLKERCKDSDKDIIKTNSTTVQL